MRMSYRCRLCLSGHVPAGLDEGDGKCLDRGGLFKAHIFYGFRNLF